MIPTKTSKVIKERTFPILPLLFFAVVPVICALLFSDAEPYAEITIEMPAKEACVTTHQTLNPNESQEVCGSIVSMK